jgi:hypothetical protein
LWDVRQAHFASHDYQKLVLDLEACRSLEIPLDIAVIADISDAVLR